MFQRLKMLHSALIVGAITLSLAIPCAEATVRVALLECLDANGKVIQFTPGGRFCHSALEIDGKWLQAYPGIGVSLVDSLEEYGHVAVILRSDAEEAPTLGQVRPLLGRPFDRAYDWSTDSSLYCSELLAKLLGIVPEPMDFSAPVWPSYYKKLHGKPGTSPDGIYRALKARGYRPE